MKKDSDLTRRGFLSTTLTGLVSAGFLSLSPHGAFAQKEKDKKIGKKEGVIYRKLGKTGIELPVVSMGVMNSNNPDIVKASYELGIRHFDTAAYYQYGRNEQMVGNVIKELGVRDDVVIATKIFTPDLRSECKPGEAQGRIMELLEVSLKRLQMDSVDILYIHNVKKKGVASDEAVMKTVTAIKKQGKARAVGVSTHTKMAEIIDEAVETGVYDVVLTAINFTMADDTALLGAIGKAAAKGVGVIAMKSQVGGRRLPRPSSAKDYSSSTIAKAALKWVLRNKDITTAIPGYTTYEHMGEDFSVAYDLEYTPEEKKLLSDNELKVGMGFCRQCHVCIDTCPRKVDIPTLMRTHMYASQYSNFHHARITLDEIQKGFGLQACRYCTECRARCANHVDIARRIDELKLIYA